MVEKQEEFREKLLSRVEDRQGGSAIRVQKLADGRIAVVVEGEEILPMSVGRFLVLTEACKKAKTELLRP